MAETLVRNESFKRDGRRNARFFLPYITLQVRSLLSLLASVNETFVWQRLDFELVYTHPGTCHRVIRRAKKGAGPRRERLLSTY